MPAIGGWILKQGEIYRIETWMTLFYMLAGSMLAGTCVMWMGNYSLLSWARDQDCDGDESNEGSGLLDKEKAKQ